MTTAPSPTDVASGPTASEYSRSEPGAVTVTLASSQAWVRSYSSDRLKTFGRSGRKKWSRQTGVEGASGPATGAGALYFSSASGRVVALSPRDGTPLWATNPQADGLTGDQGASPRVIVAGRVVVAAAAENTLFAFDALKPPKAD